MFINLIKACSAIVADSPAVSCNLDYVIVCPPLVGRRRVNPPFAHHRSIRSAIYAHVHRIFAERIEILRIDYVGRKPEAVIFIDIHYSDADTRVRLACFRVSGVSEQRLESIGWSAITVWECELSKSGIENTMEKIESMLADFRRIVGRPHAFALRFAPMHHAHRHSLGKTAFQGGWAFACTVRQGCEVRILWKKECK